MTHLPGQTVQCINPTCVERGHWMKAQHISGDQCTCCGSPLRNVPPPLAPRMRMRARPLGYRPRARGR